MKDNIISPIVILKALFISGVFLLTSLSISAADGDYNSDTNFAQVESIRMVYRADGRWDVHVTVRHNDEGWNHYADIWQVMDSETGDIIGERILAHPHDNEQPFTRSLTGLVIPDDVRKIYVRSKCSRHDFGGKEIRFEIPRGLTKGSFSIVLDQ